MAKSDRGKCVRAKLIRAVIEDTLPENVVFLRAKGEVEARQRLIDAGKAYCVARCGGCELTEGWTPPA